MPKRSILFLSVSIFLFIFHSYVTADDIDHSEQYESSVEFDKAYDCVQLEPNWHGRIHRCAKEALEISESFKNPDPKKIAIITYNYGLSLSRVFPAELKKSLKELTRASVLIEAAFDSTSCEMASVLFELALVKSELDLTNPAFSDYEKSLRICNTEKNIDYAFKILSFLQSFKLEALNKDQLVSARSFLIQAHKIYQEFMGPTDLGTRAAAFELGQLYFLTEEYQKSIETFEKSYPPETGNFKSKMGDNPETLDLLFSYLSESHEKLGNITESNKYKGFKRVARLATNIELDPRIANPDLTPIFIKQPIYPRQAQMRGQQGYAVIEMTLLPSGKVRDPRLMEERPEKFFFGKAAMRVAKDLRYSANSERPEQTVFYKYTFKMQRNR